MALFLRNQEDLDFDSKLILNNMHKHFSNPSAEGFNNKIRWLMQQAYSTIPISN
ncbi:MAG: transposase [Desulfobulbaceae bacterium]|nr:transposase [Desulfobulbaceae bacterium]